ncbi:hypothetical protein Lfu02_14650 [Longispora fulva]|uniref:IrrE N-terminal-like domain-containing protein n=1 Tax=Longispora fulva TaxID=619741 RepID=A0A8J7GVU1_9ACTN|nr:hypothetical protein [Longispora fulva]MBG6140525.1 hypothetical protein [Longispora fulva]GIG57093.1 hypothetical protein Lfu02_14650 [Longispora fulva]
MTFEEFRDLCEDAAKQFRHLIPVPWDEEAFIANLSRLRGRPITLGFYTPTGGAPCGMYLGTGQGDRLLLPSNIGGGYQRRHVLFHEIGHWWFDFDQAEHAAVEPDLLEWVKAFLDIDPETIEFALGRHGYDVPIERRAETLAHVLGDLVTELEAESEKPATTPEQAGIIARLHGSLGRPDRKQQF